MLLMEDPQGMTFRLLRCRKTSAFARKKSGTP